MSREDPPASDFASLFAMTGRRFPDPAVQQRAEEVSVWDSFERASRQGKSKPHLRFVAVLEMPEHVELREGRRGHFGIPSTVGPDEIKSWVTAVVPLP